MFRIEDILEISSGDDLCETALELFRSQYRACLPYREYIHRCGPVGIPDNILRIPFLPIELFKSHRIYCAADAPEEVFTSSTTGGTVPARHYIRALSDYEKTFRAAFSLFYGDPGKISIYALLPSYLERVGSSLIYMAENLIRSNAWGRGGFYLYDHAELIEDMEADPGPKILLGVSYALLELAGNIGSGPKNAIVMETGGMKGRGKEMPKEELHAVLASAFGVGSIHSEYGMAELSSQAYSSGDGVFRTPPWMKVVVRDPGDPFDIREYGRGALNIIDLANLNSCAFIQTDDIGTVYPDGRFTLEGRMDRSEVRGCNLLLG